VREQHKALQLADALEDCHFMFSTPLDARAAAELRRLHAVNAQMLEALELLKFYLEEWHADFPESIGDNEPAGHAKAVAAIAAAKEQA
jgi:hypothetical protein